MNFAELLIQFRKRAGLNKTDLARRLKISLGYVQHIESERRKPFPITICREISKILSLSDEESKLFIDTAIKERARPEVIEWLNSDDQPQKVPIIAWDVAGRLDKIQGPIDPRLIDETVIITTKGENMLAVRVEKDCMEPEFVHGDIVVVDPNSGPRAGMFVLVRDKAKNEAMLRRLKKTGGKMYLVPLNSKYKEIMLDEKKHLILGAIIQRHKIKEY